jgi:hypothetical protein
VRTLRSFPFVIRTAGQCVPDADPLDDENFVLEVDFAFGFRRETPLACVDPARLQRATQGAGESTGGRGDYVVEGRGVVGILARRSAIVLAHLVVCPEENRFRLDR